MFFFFVIASSLLTGGIKLPDPIKVSVELESDFALFGVSAKTVKELPELR